MKFDFKTVADYLWPLLKAVLIFVIGHYLIKWFLKIPEKALNKSKLDKSVIKLIIKFLGIGCHVLIFLSALNAIGIPTTGLLAAVSAIAVSIALALKDSLSSITGGILLLISPRFVTGDYISVDGDEGFVTSIELLHTTIRTYDNRHISFSNSLILNNKVTNYTWEGKRRVNIKFSIPYGADIELVKRVAKEVAEKHPLLLPETEGKRIFRVGEYADSAVVFWVFVWVKCEHYWVTYFDIMENLRSELIKNGIDVPFNQLDVHFDKEK